MTTAVYSLSQFVNDLRAITAETTRHGTIVQRVRPLAQRLARSTDWREARHAECDDEQGFGVYLLHEEREHDLAVFAVSWLPGRGALPHNHGTWAVVVGVEGAETNTYWKRLDDGTRPGYAEIERAGKEVVGPGAVVAMLPDAIHSVDNETDRVTLSLHVYGRHLNYIGRSEFDPDTRVERPVVRKVR